MTIDDLVTRSIDRHPAVWWLIALATVVAVIAAAVYAVDAVLAVEVAHGAPRLPKAGA